MWSIITPFLVGRGTGGWRYIRVALLFILLACLLAGVIYALVVFKAIQNRPEDHHVQHHSTR
jgi:hypothetical protein